MKKRLRDKWTKALRGGKYRQSRAQLMKKDFHGDPMFCCLGVLLHLEHPRSQSLGFDCLLRKSHVKEFGLTDDQQEVLAAMNDKGDSFKKIASYIERKL